MTMTTYVFKCGDAQFLVTADGVKHACHLIGARWVHTGRCWYQGKTWTISVCR